MWQIRMEEATILVEDGTLLFDALMKANKRVERPCAGKGTCKKCTVLVNGKEELSCQYRIHSDIDVRFIGNGEIVSETGALEEGRITDRLCYVLDLGTTTLVLALVSLDDKKIVKVVSRTNPQRLYGADVISRIEYCMKNGVEELTSVLISELNDMMEAFGLPEVERLYVAGNTTMLHLLMGMDCSSIGVAPYTPVFLGMKQEKGSNIGLKGAKEVVVLPSISSFVGADLVAGLNFVGMPEENRFHLLVDLGTNAEIILYSRESVLCTAAAAGPCFEGVNISCGMCAVKGAIYAYSSHGIKTVDNAPAMGICGTGLIDVIAKLVREEVIDETGFMECGKFEIADGVYLTQQDVRQFQTAKSAICSAIATLMDINRVSFDEIDKVYVAGGFAAKLNVQSAAKTGLLPENLISKCEPIHNSSLLGTVKYACDRDDLSIYLSNAEYVDLSANKMFSDLFIDNLCLSEVQI